MDKLPIRVRNMTEEDKNFILNSWLKSYRQAPAVKPMQNAGYYHRWSKQIKELLENADVLVACDSTDHTHIYGYLVSQRIQGVFTIHYVYTKLTYRNCGIAKLLIKARDHELGGSIGIYSHHTDSSIRLAPKYRFMYDQSTFWQFKDYLEERVDYAKVES